MVATCVRQKPLRYLRWTPSQRTRDTKFIARVGWVDTAKGIGIVLVVFGHVLRGLVTSHLTEWTQALHYMDAWIYAFHMPLFFFLSGLLLSRAASQSVLTFTWNKVRTIAYPYFLWSFFTLVTKDLLGATVNQPRELSQFPGVVYQPIEQFWFLYVLFLLSCAVGLLIKFQISPLLIAVTACLIYPGVFPIDHLAWDPIVEAKDFVIYLALGVLIGIQRLVIPAAMVRNANLVVLACTSFFVVSRFVVPEIFQFTRAADWSRNSRHYRCVVARDMARSHAYTPRYQLSWTVLTGDLCRPHDGVGCNSDPIAGCPSSICTYSILGVVYLSWSFCSGVVRILSAANRGRLAVRITGLESRRISAMATACSDV